MVEAYVRALIVENDTEWFRRFDELVIQSKRSFVRFHRVTTLDQACEYLQKETVDVVILALALKNGDGKKALDRIRAANNHLPVIGIKSMDEDQDGLDCCISRSELDDKFFYVAVANTLQEFDLNETMKRIETNLRRTNQHLECCLGKANAA